MDHKWIKIQSDLEINVTPANTLAPLLPPSSLSLEAGRIKHAGLSSRRATIHSAAVVKQTTFIQTSVETVEPGGMFLDVRFDGKEIRVDEVGGLLVLV